MVRTITRDVIELEPQILLSRELLQGAALVRDDVELVAWHLYDEARPTATATAQGVLHPDDAVFDTLQTGPEWTEDDEGYNLSVRIPGAHLTPGGTTLRLEVILHGGHGRGLRGAYGALVPESAESEDGMTGSFEVGAPREERVRVKRSRASDGMDAWIVDAMPDSTTQEVLDAVEAGDKSLDPYEMYLVDTSDQAIAARQHFVEHGTLRGFDPSKMSGAHN